MSTESEQRYRSYVHHFPGIAFCGTFDFRPTMFDGAVEKITGYSADTFLSGKRRWDEVVHPDDLPDLHAIADALRNVAGYSTEREYRILRQDGEIRWIREIIQNTCDDAGQPVAVQGVLYDVTDRRAAEENLRESREQWRSITENSPDHIMTLDHHGTILFINRTVPDLQKDQVIGTPVFDYVPPEFWPDMKGCFQRVIDTGQPDRYEVEYHAASGEIQYFESRVGPVLQNGKVAALTVTSTNVTDRKHAEEQLRQAHDELEQRVRARTSELVTANDRLRVEVAQRKRIESELRQTNQELQAMYEGMADGVLIADKQTRQFLRANPAICRLLGYTEQEFLDMSPADIHPQEELPRILDYFNAMADGRLERVADLPCLCRDGTFRYADVSALHLTYRGHPCLVGFFHDVSERKKLEKELSEISTREQQRLGRQLHDQLGQQLVGARLTAASLEQSLQRGKPPDKEVVATLTEALTDAQNSVHDMIRGFQPVEVDARGLMAAISELATSTQRVFNIPCRFQCSEPVPVEDNHTATQLFYITREAVLNAVRHAHASQITIGLENDDERLNLWVRDDGTGISGDTAETTPGMGLRIMRHRAAVVGAVLSIQSGPDGGTQVTCTLTSESLR